MSERRTIVSHRVADASLAVPGAVGLPCGTCGAPTWVSPTSMPLLVEGAVLCCIPCMPPDALHAGLEAAPGAFDEVEMVDGPEARQAAERALERLNRFRRQK